MLLPLPRTAFFRRVFHITLVSINFAASEGAPPTLTRFTSSGLFCTAPIACFVSSVTLRPVGNAVLFLYLYITCLFTKPQVFIESGGLTSYLLYSALCTDRHLACTEHPILGVPKITLTNIRDTFPSPFPFPLFLLIWRLLHYKKYQKQIQ